jgi:hypothetical protein
MSVRRQSLCFVVSLALVLGGLLIPSGALGYVWETNPDQLTDIARADGTYSNGNQPQPCNEICN